MGFFDLLKKVTESNVEDTTTVTYTADAWSDSSANAAVDNVAESQSQESVSGAFRFAVQDVFCITGRGTVVTGIVEAGQVSVGDIVQLRRTNGECKNVTVSAIEVFRKLLDTATEGMNVGIQISDVTKSDVSRGDVLER